MKNKTLRVKKLQKVLIFCSIPAFKHYLEEVSREKEVSPTSFGHHLIFLPRHLSLYSKFRICHLRDRHRTIVSGIKLVAHCLEGIDRTLHILHRVSRRRY